jgi:hypothetical protein
LKQVCEVTMVSDCCWVAGLILWPTPAVGMFFCR